MLTGRIWHSSASPARIANSTTFSFSTGRTPGIPRQTWQVWWLGGAPNAVEHPQKILVAVRSWACTSRPITGWKSETGIGSDRRSPVVEVLLALEGPCHPKDPRLVERSSEHLQADRQASPGESAGQAQAGQPREIARQGEHVGEVHRQRVRHLLAELEGGDRRGRGDQRVHLLEGLGEVPANQGPDLLGLGVVRVVVAGGERVRPEHDSPLHLRAEALGPGLLVELAE